MCFPRVSVRLVSLTKSGLCPPQRRMSRAHQGARGPLFTMVYYEKVFSDSKYSPVLGRSRERAYDWHTTHGLSMLHYTAMVFEGVVDDDGDADHTQVMMRVVMSRGSRQCDARDEVGLLYFISSFAGALNSRETRQDAK